MTSWVYLFSKFTPEALLFEASFLFFICAFYFGYWILHKRKDGVAGKTLPAGMVKFYLNNLIKQAEFLRAQLFGLLNNGEIPPEEMEKMMTGMSMPSFAGMGMQHSGATQGAGMSAGAGGASDPALLQKLADLENKMSEQSSAMENMIAEKTTLEQELDAARVAAASAGGAVSSGNSADASKLKDKVNSLEARLAEYSVIEDDLANLKRLQQENASLKAALAQGGGKPAAAAVATTVAAPTPAPAPAQTPAPKAAEPDPLAELEASIASPAPEPMVEPEAPAAAPFDAPDASFESLVDEVEKSLDTAKTDELLNSKAAAPAAPAAAPAGASAIDTAAPAAAPTPEPQSITAAAPAPTGEADLVAEFEKMLNG
ncbi:hypothetical protein WDW86_19625 [Bdellovibrionota bacterium FG-2]